MMAEGLHLCAIILHTAMKNIKYTLASLLVAIGLKACWVDEKSQKIELKGTFINDSYLRRSSDSLFAVIPFYATELVFERPDSVLIRNGVEEYSLAYTISHDTCYVHQAYQNHGLLEDLRLVILSDTTFDALEQAFTGTQEAARFVKTSVFEGFEYQLRSQLAGQYDLKGKEKQRVILHANGKIEGLGDYDTFELCYAGDCLSEPAKIANVMQLSNPRKQEFVVWEYDQDRGMLRIYQLQAARPDTKGEREIASKLFELKKRS